jgi:hypothetical protein
MRHSFSLTWGRSTLLQLWQTQLGQATGAPFHVDGIAGCALRFQTYARKARLE